MMRFIYIFICMVFPALLSAQDSLGTHISYDLTAETAVGGGEYVAFQTVTNRFSTQGIRSNTATLRATVGLEHRFSEQYVLSGKVDAIASVHADHRAYLQQCYVNMKLNRFFLEAGTREIEPVLRDRRLTSGAFVESGNAKPVPQVRFGTDGFWTVPYTKGWLELYFDFAYGHYLDDGYVEDKGREFREKTGYATFYTTGRWYHHKQLYFRSNSTKRFFGMVGCNHLAQFGGIYHPLGMEVSFPTDLRPSLKDFFNVIIPQGDDASGQWISGNHLGTLTFQIGWNINRDHQLQAYLDNIFEDGSGIRKGNGWDGIWGLEYRNRAKGVQRVRGAVFEYVQTTHQSGYIHWDKDDYEPPYNGISGMQDLVTGNDDYYNNYLMQSYAQYGIAQGNALLMSPRYNKDSYNGFVNNAIKAWHLGIEGDIMDGNSGYVGYLVRGSYREGWGTHFVPLEEKAHSFSALVQLDWKKGPWRASAGYAFDRGTIYGNNNTFDLTVTYHGKIL